VVTSVRASATCATVAVLTAPATGRPGIGRRAAQRLAREELSKPMYHPRTPLIQRIIEAVLRFLARIFHAASGAAPGGWWGLVALAALVVIVAAGLRAWMGPVARAHRSQGPLTPQGQARTARDHRQDAERLAGAGDYAAAIRECVRAIAAELDERAVLPPRTGRTANEFAEEAGRALPAHAPALREAAWQFDEVCYGQRAGTKAGYERLRDLDKQVMASAPRVSRAAPSPVMAGEAAS
jgi:Domain of unknown function (DUF4129)